MASSTLTLFKRLVEQSGRLFRPYEYAPNLLPAEVALAIMEELKSEPLAIVGGDIWMAEESRFEIRDGWVCEKHASESPMDFAHRSMLVASQVLQTRPTAQQLEDKYVDLVIKDAVTGEALPAV